jgi:hypothetical protein
MSPFPEPKPDTCFQIIDFRSYQNLGTFILGALKLTCALRFFGFLQDIFCGWHINLLAQDLEISFGRKIKERLILMLFMLSQNVSCF